MAAQNVSEEKSLKQDDLIVHLILGLRNIYLWLGKRDLNPRPPRPERGALPSCATTRNLAVYEYVYLLAQ